MCAKKKHDFISQMAIANHMENMMCECDVLIEITFQMEMSCKIYITRTTLFLRTYIIRIYFENKFKCHY